MSTTSTGSSFDFNTVAACHCLLLAPFSLNLCSNLCPKIRRTSLNNACRVYVVAACFPCNQRKGDRTPEEARMPLLKNPAALVYGIDRQILCHEADSRREWRKYLFLDEADGAA